MEQDIIAMEMVMEIINGDGDGIGDDCFEEE